MAKKLATLVRDVAAVVGDGGRADRWLAATGMATGLYLTTEDRGERQYGPLGWDGIPAEADLEEIAEEHIRTACDQLGVDWANYLDS